MGSLKAELCVEGNSRIYEFCRRNGVPAEATGKLVVATSREQIPALEALLARARSNGAPGVAMVGREAARRLERNVEVPAAMLCPSTGIVHAAEYVRALAARARAAGSELMTSFEVVSVEASGGSFEITGRRGGRRETFRAGAIVNSAGLESDRVARMVDPVFPAELAPLRGEYFKFNRRRRPALWLESKNVYPLPESVEVGGTTKSVVGVHLTPTFGIDSPGLTSSPAIARKVRGMLL